MWGLLRSTVLFVRKSSFHCIHVLPQVPHNLDGYEWMKVAMWNVDYAHTSYARAQVSIISLYSLAFKWVWKIWFRCLEIENSQYFLINSLIFENRRHHWFITPHNVSFTIMFIIWASMSLWPTWLFKVTGRSLASRLY